MHFSLHKLSRLTWMAIVSKLMESVQLKQMWGTVTTNYKHVLRIISAKIKSARAFIFELPKYVTYCTLVHYRYAF